MSEVVVIELSLLLDIEDGDRMAEEVFEKITAHRLRPAMPPTACHELLMHALTNGIPQHDALRSWNAYNVIFLNVADDAINNGFAGEAASALLREGLVAEPLTNLAHMIAESAVYKAKAIILDDYTATTLNRPKIERLLEDRHLSAPKIFSRTEFLKT